MFISLQLAQKIEIRAKLLQCLEQEAVPNIRHKIGDAVAEVARQYSEEGGSAMYFLVVNRLFHGCAEVDRS